MNHACISAKSFAALPLTRESIPPYFLRGIKDARTGFHLRNEKASGLLLPPKCGSRAKSMVELSTASKACMPSKSVAISVRG